jgi:carbon starvation protein
MDALLIALLSAGGFVLAYLTYGRWLGKKIFRLSAQAVCPSVEFRDDSDYVPTPKWVVFGHHFTSIAGTGPIVGPAIALAWGWLPALAWVLLGSIFIGAVHDFGALVVSLRNRGATIGDVAGVLLNKRVRFLFLGILFLALTIVLAIFGMVIATVFRQFPAAIFPCLAQIPLAAVVGFATRKRPEWLGWLSLVSLMLMYVSVVFGDVGLLGDLNRQLAGWSNGTWVLALLLYSYVASVLPVWSLLQPRDFINSLQLISVMLLLFVGLVVATVFGSPSLGGEGKIYLEMVAPLVRLEVDGAPAIFPFLFITVACGAVSGFHCLVSSGTSAKQLVCEKDARFVGYGSMLLEGFLAVLVILCCGAAIGLGVRGSGGELLSGSAAWEMRYASWTSGLSAMVANFVDGAENLLYAVGFTEGVGAALMGVFLASFAATTLDSACRLQRYVVQELMGALWGIARPGDADRRVVRSILLNKHFATIIAVGLAMLLASVPPSGKNWSWENAGTGGLVLWPLFGATNQLLGGLAFIVIVFYLMRLRVTWCFVLFPLFFMLVVPAWAMIVQCFIGSGKSSSWLAEGNWVLVSLTVGCLILEIWMIVESFFIYLRLRKMNLNICNNVVDFTNS